MDSLTRPLIFALPGNEDMAGRLLTMLGAEVGALETRRFPDEETYLRFVTDPAGRSVVLVCTLDRPDPKFLRLVYAAAAARDLKAKRVGIIAPYLAYMRQDQRFQPGEAVSSAAFARLLSAEIDWLATVDPHLHRYPGLDAIYRVPTRVAHSASLLAAWIKLNVSRPLLIGPDLESEQWVSAVAAMADAPYRVLRKERRGDRDVEITVPDLHLFADRIPVLVDDIVSTGGTMIETVQHLRRQGLPPAVCLAVHALFSAESYGRLKEAASVVVTTNAVPHPSNGIDVAPAIAASLAGLL